MSSSPVSSTVGDNVRSQGDARLFAFCIFILLFSCLRSVRDKVQVQLKRALLFSSFLYFILPSFVPNFAHVNVRYVVAIASSRYRCFSRGLNGIVGRMIIRVADEIC